MTENFKALTDLQLKVGYKEGPPNTVALLGLFGEAGEVIGEITLDIEASKLSHEHATITESMIIDMVGVSSSVDNLKKAIRDNKVPPVFFKVENIDAYDKELADNLYYLNALAINRGKTLDYYAGLSVQKVLTKQATNISHATNNK